MEEAEAQRIIASIKFPNAKFFCGTSYEMDYDHFHIGKFLRLNIVFTVKDSEYPFTENIPVTSSARFRPNSMQGEEQLIRFVWGRVFDFLRHDGAEWFEYNGKRPFHPHRPNCEVSRAPEPRILGTGIIIKKEDINLPIFNNLGLDKY